MLTVNGCDSVAVLNLTVNQSDSSYSSIIICDSYAWDGTSYTTNGVYSNTYTNAAGCDSVHTLNLTINNSITGTSQLQHILTLRMELHTQQVEYIVIHILM